MASSDNTVVKPELRWNRTPSHAPVDCVSGKATLSEETRDLLLKRFTRDAAVWWLKHEPEWARGNGSRSPDESARTAIQA